VKRKRDEKVDFENGWAAGWYRKRFRELVDMPAFHGVVTLARLTNMIRFVYSVMVRVEGVGPESRRQRTNSFYFAGAIMVEAEKTIHGVGRYFSGEPDYIDLVKSVHTETFTKVVSRFREFRNRAAFHVNQEDVDRSLERIAGRKKDFYPFLTAYGRVSKDMYYDLADEAAMELILGEDDYGEWLKEWFGLSAKAIHDLFDALEEFIGERVKGWNPQLVSTTDDKPPDIEETRRIFAEREAAKTPASSDAGSSTVTSAETDQGQAESSPAE
jgi:hypothetical protein